MKKVLVLLVLITFMGFAQSEDVPVDHKVYDFLERLSVLHVIDNYNSFEIPVSRKQIAGFLTEASKKDTLLTKVDRQRLADLKQEFEFDITGTLTSSEVLFGGENYELLSPNPKYFYSYNKPGTGNVFINLLAGGGIVNYKTLSENSTSILAYYGGEIRGTLMDHVGFYIKGTNGNVFGRREAALHLNNLKYNWDLTTKANTFYDETEGYVTLDYDAIKLKFGRDRQLIGQGVNKLILSDNSPECDFLSMNFHLGIIEFSSFHGKILGNRGEIVDTSAGGLATVEDKYFGYHRLAFNFSKDFSLGLGEVIVYANRSIDLGYLNPFSLYKTVEHSGQDRDNSMMFLDMTSSPLKGLKLYSLLLIDDIDFGKAGTGWFGNQTVFDLGASGYSTVKDIPVDYCFEYFRIEPYVFTHRISSNNYTNEGFNIGLDSDPNSKIFFWKIGCQPTSRINLFAQYTYRVHGANPVDPVTGAVITNVGGDVLLGHREYDPKYLHFLDGNIEYYRRLTIGAGYEPCTGYIFKLMLTNDTNSLQNNVKVKNWFSQAALSLRL